MNEREFKGRILKLDQMIAGDWEVRENSLANMLGGGGQAMEPQTLDKGADKFYDKFGPVIREILGKDYVAFKKPK